MLNFRDRARILLQGLGPAPKARVQPYQVLCPGGHRLYGERTVGYQAVRCPSCGAVVFILPRSPLPEPSIPPSRSRKRERVPAAALASSVESQTDVEGIYEAEAQVEARPDADPVAAGLEEIEQTEKEKGNGYQVKPAALSRPAVRAVPSSRKPRPDSDSGQGREGGSVLAASLEPVATRPQDRSTRESLSRWLNRRRNLLLLLAVVLLITATITVRQRRLMRQNLPRIAELGRTEGLVALDEGKFDKAHQLLSEARRAVDALGGAVEGAAAIRQGAAEASIFVKLVPERLESILDQAGRYDPKEWPAHFQVLYQGRTIIVDAQIVAVPGQEGTGDGAYELDYQIFPDGEGQPARLARIDTRGFRLFADARPKVGDRVQFGARLAGFTYNQEAEEWRITLEPDSGVFLTHPQALEVLGWPGADEPSTSSAVGDESPWERGGARP